MLRCTGSVGRRAALVLVMVLAAGGAAAQLTADPTFDTNGLKVDVAPRVTEGASTTITVTLKAEVRAGTTTATTVTVEVIEETAYGATSEADDVILNPGTATLSFPANTTSSEVTHQVSGTIPLQTFGDPDAEDETVVLAISATGGDISIQAGDQTGEEPRKTLTIDDDETQTYVLALAAGAAPREGAGAFDVEVRAVPAHVDDRKTLTLQIDDTDYAIDTDDGTDGNQISGTLDRGTTSFTAEVTPPTNDGDRADDTVTLKAYSGTVGASVEEASLPVVVADAHRLPAPAAVTVEATDAGGNPVTSLAEGGAAVNLTVSVDRGRGAGAATGEALSVALALAPADPAHASSYRLAPAAVALPAVTTPAGKQTSTTAVRLEALADEFVNDDRLTVNLTTTGETANGAGSVDSTFTIAVRDTTVKRVSAKPDSAVKAAFDAAQAAAAGADGLNPGESFSVAGSALFEGPALAGLAYTASSSDPSVRVSTSGAGMMITAVSAGTSTVRVVARAAAASAVPQTRADEAAVEHVVTVVETPLRLTLAADPAAVPEGGAITLTVRSNRAVLAGEDASVRLEVVGPVVAPAPSSVVIQTGATTGTAVLTVADDDEVRDLGTVTVVATGGALAPNPTRLEVRVIENDVADAPLNVTLTSDPAGAVPEGGAITLTATAARAVLAGEDATVRLEVVGPVVAPAPSSIVIQAGATTGTAVLTVLDDDEVKDLGTVTVVATGAPLAADPTRLEVRVTENDVDTRYDYTFTAAAARVTEGAEVVLAVTAAPAVEAETVITLTAYPASLAADYALEPKAIVIPAGGTSGTAAVRTVDDGEVEDDETLTVTAAAPGNVLIGSVEITIVDNDAPVRTVRARADAAATIAAAISTAAGGGAWTAGGTAATVEMDGLFDVDPGVEALYQGVSSDPGVVLATATGNTLSLAPVGAGSAVITVTGTDRSGGSPAAEVTHVAAVALPALRVTVTAAPLTIPEGGTSTITAKANRAVAAADGPVRVNLTVVGDAALIPAFIEIPAGSDAGSAILASTDDDDHEPGGETLTVIASGSGVEGNVSIDIRVTDDDADTQYAYTFTASETRVAEGGAATLTVTAAPAVEAETVITLTAYPASLAADYDLEPKEIVIPAGGTGGTAALRAVDDGEVEDDETLTVAAAAPGNVLIGAVEITIVDDDAPAVTVRARAGAPQMIADAIARAAGGAPWMVGGMAAEVDMAALFEVDEGVTAAFSGVSSDSTVVGAVTIGGNMLALTPMGAGTATITVTGADPAGGSPAAVVTYDASVAAADVAYTLSAPADANLIEGASVELTVTASRPVTAGTEVSILRDRASTAAEADYTVTTATIPAGGTVGTATVTALEDGVDEGGEVLTLYGVVGGAETNAVTLTIWDAAVPALPILAQLLLAAFLAVGGYRRYLRR